ncbi:MAG TPA: exo-alpha-sialidase [Thermoplasmatales archaeon]|nr:exo-alpha-sialidase [Thermoplasmatales archaeon]
MPRNIVEPKTKLTVIAGCFTVVIFSMSFLAASYPEGWTAKPLTSLPKELHEAPSIAVYEKNIHVVWNTWHNEFDSKIYYRHSLDNGKTWSEPVCLTPNSTTAIYPVVAVNATIVHVAWKDYRNGNPEIYYRRSVDNGQSWSEVQRITYNSSRKNNIYDVGIVVDGSNVYLVWKDYRSGSSEVFFKKSVDNGESWGSDQRLTYDYTPSYAPCMAVNGENIYIAWEDWGHRSNICFMKSSNAGVNWTEKIFLTENVTAGDSEHPSLAVWENKVYLVWQDTRTGNSEIYFKKSIDYGESWNETRRITDNTTVRFNPKIGVYGERLVIVGQGKEEGRFIIWYMTSDDGGENWSDPVKLTDGEVDAYDTSMFIQSYDIYVVWQKYYEAGWADIWFMSRSSGKPVVTSILLSNTSVSLPAVVDVTVDGFDPTYDKKELTCIVQYKSPSGSWNNVHSEFTGEEWEAHIDFSIDFSSGGCLVRAKLINPEGIESEWSVYKTVELHGEDSDSSVPSFTLPLMTFVLLAVIILIRVRDHEEK